MKSNTFKLFAVTLFVLVACNLQSISESINIGGPSRGDPNSPGPLTVIIPNADDATPTPFLPLDPTARALTPTAVPTAPWGGFPGPSVPPAIPIPPPAEAIVQPAGQFNFLLLGSDQRPNSGGFRTDTILLVTLNPDLSWVSMTSFPRDLYVYIPGWTMERINTAQARGGFESSQLTFEYNFGFRPDYYALINFWSFQAIIDNLGGIYVNVGRTHTDHRDGHGNYTVPAGRVLMDGETALWYARSRYSTSDFDRTRRQQEVMLGIFFRMISLDGIRRAPELYNLYAGNVQTNASFSDLSPFLGLAGQVAGEPSLIRTYAISSRHVTSFRVPGTGAAVLLPDYDSISILLREALNAPR